MFAKITVDPAAIEALRGSAVPTTAPPPCLDNAPEEAYAAVLRYVVQRLNEQADK